MSPPASEGTNFADIAGDQGTTQAFRVWRAIRSSEPRRRHPSAHRRNPLRVQSAAGVKGGEAGERSSRTLDAREH